MCCASNKKLFSSCCKCSSLHPKRPNGRERCVKPMAGKRLAENIGTPMYLSASVHVFLYSKIVHINPLLKAMFQAERFDSESDVSTLYDIV